MVVGLGQILGSICLGVTSGLFLDPTLPCLGVPYPLTPGGYSFKDEGGVSLTQTEPAFVSGLDHGGHKHLCSWQV